MSVACQVDLELLRRDLQTQPPCPSSRRLSMQPSIIRYSSSRQGRYPGVAPTCSSARESERASLSVVSFRLSIAGAGNGLTL